MQWIALSEKDNNSAALEKHRLDATDQFRANYCPDTIFLRFDKLDLGTKRASQLALVVTLLTLICGCSSPAPKAIPAAMFNVHELGVIRDVLPLAVQPEQVKWRQLRAGMTESEVTALLGNPYRKDARPTAHTTPNLIHLYAWYYGEISFQSYTTKGSYYYAVTFHEGRVRKISDPWKGKFSPDGQPTVPELLLPAAGQTLHHYPRFLDFRWHPSSGVYPVEYEVVVQALDVDQEESEHYEDYIRKTVDSNRAQWKAEGMTPKSMADLAASFARELRKRQGVVQTFQFHTHDIYLPLTWVGANTGRWRVRATNEKGSSEWTPWRYFDFSS